MSKFDLLKNEILDILSNSPILNDRDHSQSALKWILILKPDADESLQIAALSHDIDRGVTGITEKDCKDYSKIKEFKKEHAIRSANIIGDLMKKHRYNQPAIDKVKHLVESHEEGGDIEQDILMQADSLSYFELNIPMYLNRYGREQTIKKIQFMYKRLSEKSRQSIKQIKFAEDVKELVQEATSDI
jgi:hypothetical protein